MYLEAEKKKGNAESVGTKCKLIEEEIFNVKRQRVEITQSIVKLQDSRDKLYIEAGEKKDLDLLDQANLFW